MVDNHEKILVIFSTKKTEQNDLKTVKSAISSFQLPRLSIRTNPIVFQIPPRARVGASLGSDLIKEFGECIGAVAFVDDLRPNVAYELGLFHGRGSPVLLMTRKGVDSVSNSFSDIGGAPIADINVTDIKTAINGYLCSLYERHLRNVKTVPIVPMPDKNHNFLVEWAKEGKFTPFENGPWGPILRIPDWDSVDVSMSLNLFKDAIWYTVIRAGAIGTDYTIYFFICYRDHTSIKRKIWLGVTSTQCDASITGKERLLPSQTPTNNWSFICGCFSDQLSQVSILGDAYPIHIEKIRFKAGTKYSNQPSPIDIGFFEINGARG